MKLTREQQKAIYTLNKNLLLNAGAGTGKTEVLTRRFVKMISSGINLENIVCITFTKKAAKEMQERIREIFIEDGLNNELDHFYKANISTIDSFCQTIISEYSKFCNINPNFKVLDDKDSKDLLEQAVRRTIRQYPEYLEIFYQDLGFFTEDEIISELLSFLKSKKDMLDIKKIKEKNKAIFENYSEERIHEELKEELLQIADLLKDNRRSGIAKFLKDENVDKLKVPGKLSKNYIEHLKGLNFTIKPLKEKNKEKVIPEILENFNLINDIKSMEVYSTFFSLLEKILFEYKSEKLENGLLDFSDLAINTLKLLDIPEVKDQLLKKYTHFLIDEYQDCSTIQKDLFYKFCSEDIPLDRENFFAVGDPKQSIYAFRGARSNVFTETMDDVLSSGGEVLLLQDNFRSTKEIMTPINHLFQDVMGERYDAQVTHKEGKDIGIQSEFFISEDVDNRPETIQAVDFIKYKVKENIPFGDFTYLFRKRSKLKDYEEILKAENIPYYIVNSQGFFNDPIISDLVNFMIYCIFPELKYLISILKGVFYNYSDEDLYKVFVLEEEKILEKIENQRERYLKVFNESIYDGLSRLIKEYDVLEISDWFSNDFQQQANIYKLLLLALNYDMEDCSFYDFVLEIIDKDYEEEHMQLEDEKSDIVKLMTIHQSKGLSLESVIIPRLSERNASQNIKIKFHEEVGLSLPINEGGLEKIVQRTINKEDTEQMENLFYVAMTRAKNNLFLGMDGWNSGFKRLINESLEIELEENRIQKFSIRDIQVKKEEREIRPIQKILELEKNNTFRKRNNYNIHMVQDFYNDREKYIRNQIEVFNEPDQKKTPLSTIGNFVHYFAEIYDGSFNRSFMKAKNKFPLLDKDLKEVKTYCQNFIEMNPLTENILKEQSFNMLYRNYHFSGVIDRIEIFKDSIKLVDFKISNLGDSIIEIYKLQMLFYAYALKEYYPKKEIIIELQNLKNKRSYLLDYDEEFLDLRMAEFIEFSNELE